MYTIWIIEKPKPFADSLACTLLGDHAVRVFASLQSFKTLAKFGHKRGPDILVIADECLQSQDGQDFWSIKQLLGSIPVMVITNDLSKNVIDYGKSIPRVSRPINPLQFNQKISSLLADLTNLPTRTLRFKDVMLDFEQLTLTVLPGGEYQTLPRKEAQLLQLFIEKAGICLSREEIKNTIWQGVQVTSRNIDSYVSKLRGRLEDSDASIESIYGGGYIFR